MKQARTHVCHAVAGKVHHAAHANDLTGPAKVLCGRVGVSQYRLTSTLKSKVSGQHVIHCYGCRVHSEASESLALCL
jgi:hypothetical protein